MEPAYLIVSSLNTCNPVAESYAPALTLVQSPVTTGWQAQGIGDFDGDGKNDLLWRDAESGQVAVWMMNGVDVVTSAMTSLNPGAGWLVQGIGDFDGDGKSDILWRDASTGQTAIWFMSGATVTSSSNT
ncbi:MAG: VCBS repeat-containing protein, partial [Nitrospinae bacterium]|nr:VCBS repeat-containing protein [Nitrospinota bacterium]